MATDGRIFQTILSSGPHSACCLLIRQYKDPLITNGSIDVPYQDYSHDGYNCSENSVTELTDRPSENPVPDVGLSNEIYESLSSADQFWAGHTHRTCGPWVFPNLTAIFVAFHSSETLNGPLGFKLPPQQLYMIFTNTFCTCVYRQTPPTPNPTPTPVNAPTSIPSHSPGFCAQPTLSVQSMNTTASSTSSMSKISWNVSVAPATPTSDAQSFSPPVSILPTISSSLTLAPARSTEPRLQSKSPSVSNQSVSNQGRTLCFPATATVEIEGGSFKQMELLQIGDRVLVSAGEIYAKVYSPVFVFTHRNPRGLYEFVKICVTQTCILITSGHYIYVRIECDDEKEYVVPANSVRAGQCMQLSNGRWASVEYVSAEYARGLYNPHTLHGDLVVNNVRVSTFTTIFHPRSAHAMLLPLRIIYVIRMTMKELFRETT